MEEKRYCPNCGADVSKEVETEMGLVCPVCHADFWPSECLTDADTEKLPLIQLRTWGNRV